MKTRSATMYHCKNVKEVVSMQIERELGQEAKKKIDEMHFMVALTLFTSEVCCDFPQVRMTIRKIVYNNTLNLFIKVCIIFSTKTHVNLKNGYLFVTKAKHVCDRFETLQQKHQFLCEILKEELSMKMSMQILCYYTLQPAVSHAPSASLKYLQLADTS